MKTIQVFSSISLKNLYLELESIFSLHDNLKVLPLVTFNSIFGYDEELIESSFSVIIMREYLTDREPQHEWFQRMTENFRNKTTDKTLIFALSIDEMEINNKRRDLYLTKIPNVQIEYLHTYSKLSETDVVRMKDITNQFILDNI